MKNQRRTLVVDELQVEIGLWLELSNAPELEPLAEVVLLLSKNEAADCHVKAPPGHLVEGVLRAIAAGESVGTPYLGISPIWENQRSYSENAIRAYEGLTGRTLGEDAYEVWVATDLDDIKSFALPRTTLRKLIEAARAYWDDWAEDPPEPPPRVPQPPPPPRPEPSVFLAEPEPGPPFVPVASLDSYFVEEIEPHAAAFLATIDAGQALASYRRVPTLGLMANHVLDVRGEGLADYFRRIGCPACARFHEAAQALLAYYRSPTRVEIVGLDVVPPYIAEGPVAIELFVRPPPDHALLARAERSVRETAFAREETSGELFVRDDQGWLTIAWKRNHLHMPTIFAVRPGKP